MICPPCKTMVKLSLEDRSRSELHARELAAAERDLGDMLSVHAGELREEIALLQAELLTARKEIVRLKAQLKPAHPYIHRARRSA